MYSLLILKSDDDFCIIKSENCEVCFQNKKHTKILKKFEIQKKEAKELRTFGVMVFNVICVCKHGTYVSVGITRRHGADGRHSVSQSESVSKPIFKGTIKII